MSKLLLLYCVLLFNLLFLVIPRTEPIDFFLFYDIKLTLQTHIYFICERLTMIILAWVLLQQSDQYKGAMWVFFSLMCFDLVDYLLTYNSVWFNVGFPVSANTLSAIIFGLTIIWQWLKD